MLRRSDERTFVKRKAFGGAGEMKGFQILNGAEEMYGKGRLFNHVTLEPGDEIGWHIHSGDGETYYILKGTGLYSDNGTPVQLNPGDVAFCDEGEGHSLINNGQEALELIALILYT